MKKEKAVKASGILILGLAIGVFLNISEQGAVSSGLEASDWRNVTVQDVATGENFTVSGLEKPVLVETFAVWCPTCTRQQQEIKELKEEINVTSVSLDVDPNEQAQKVRNHIQRNNFTWRYAVAPTGLTQMLVNRYGPSLANPPSTPVVLVCENSTRKLENGVKTSSELEEEIDQGC